MDYIRWAFLLGWLGKINQPQKSHWENLLKTPVGYRLMIKSFIERNFSFVGAWIMQIQKRSLPEKILAAYRQGQFPMVNRFGFISWKRPQVRALIPLDERFHIGKRLTKKLEAQIFEVTFDQAFADVIHNCARPSTHARDVWLTPELIEAYIRLHKLGHAHSVEVWHDGKLVGGEYGLAIGGFYAGESMFHYEDYASRVALVHLVNRLRAKGFTLLDTQYLNATSREFGGYEIELAEYNALLAAALARAETSF
ncbi:MAG: leucyl/phenylalanyl-tRNA--protein transferase [Anaerolineales bacterium]|nr:leucyl/phenylalanyl-tRNA--protein transferase [Anaerolineales bacterium]